MYTPLEADVLSSKMSWRNFNVALGRNNISVGVVRAYVLNCLFYSKFNQLPGLFGSLIRFPPNLKRSTNKNPFHSSPAEQLLSRFTKGQSVRFQKGLSWKEDVSTCLEFIYFAMKRSHVRHPLEGNPEMRDRV